MLRLTILCENTAVPSVGIIGEHGFAVLIETAESTFLFDTGQSDSIIRNAEQLGKNLKKIKKIILSHGHYDHTGGLESVLKHKGEIDVHCHPNVFLNRVVLIKKNEKKAKRQIGIPQNKRAYESFGAHFVFNKNFIEVMPNIYLTGEVPRLTSFEKHDKRLMVIKDKKLIQDSLFDDQTLVLQTRKGLIVILGCAHSGIINTLNYIQKKLSGHKIYMVIGGTHLGFLTNNQVNKTIEALNGFSIKRIGISHCTGLGSGLKLIQIFGKKVFFANAGSVIEI